MLRVEFISSEVEPDLIVSFALAPSAARSLTLLRSPQYEFLLPQEERGVSVGPLDARDTERDLLRSVQWLRHRVDITTERHRYVLDVSGVDSDEVARARGVLRRMTKDGAARVDEEA